MILPVTIGTLKLLRQNTFLCGFDLPPDKSRLCISTSYALFMNNNRPISKRRLVGMLVVGLLVATSSNEASAASRSEISVLPTSTLESLDQLLSGRNVWKPQKSLKGFDFYPSGMTWKVSEFAPNFTSCQALDVVETPNEFDEDWPKCAPDWDPTAWPGRAPTLMSVVSYGILPKSPAGGTLTFNLSEVCDKFPGETCRISYPGNVAHGNALRTPTLIENEQALDQGERDASQACQTRDVDFVYWLYFDDPGATTRLGVDDVMPTCGVMTRYATEATRNIVPSQRGLVYATVPLGTTRFPVKFSGGGYGPSVMCRYVEFHNQWNCSREPGRSAVAGTGYLEVTVGRGGLSKVSFVR